MQASPSKCERRLHGLRTLRVAVTLSFIALPALAAPPQYAQVAETCGWSFMEPRAVPPTVESLLDRAQVAPDWPADAEVQLLRWYRDCDETAGRMAVQTLQRAQRRTNSSDPVLLALLGVALVRGPEVQVPRSVGAYLRSTHHFSNSERDGARLLARVAESEGWREVWQEMAAVAVATRKDETLKLASSTLWELADTADDPELSSTLAEVELVRGDSAAAERASARAANAGAPRGMRVAGILRLRAGNDAEGAALYLRGLGLAFEDADVQPYFDDLRMLLGEDELAQWLALEAGRADWIRRKWEWRAQMAGVHLDERLGVHERRFVEAMSLYNRLSFRGAPATDEMWAYDTGVWRQPLDDRGVIFLRHGEPVRRIGATWIYPGPTSKPVVLEFRRAFRADYYLAEPAPCWPHGTGGNERARIPSDYALDLATYAPVLGWYYIRCQTAENGIFGWSDARTGARRDADAAWNSESGVVRFRQPLRAAWNLYTFQSAAGPELVSFLTIETAGLEPAEAPRTRADFGLLLSIGDPVAETSSQLDTTLSYVSATPLPPDASLQWALPVRTPANENARVVLTLRNRADATQGRVLSTTWQVPAFEGALLLSDLVVAEPRAGVLRRGTHEIAPAPGHAVFESTPFRLYYELYGARPGDPLSVTIRVLPAKGESILEKLQELISSREALSVSFEEQAVPDADGMLRVERDYQAELEPGAYSVVVTIHDARTDETVTADTNIIVASR